MGTEQSVQMIKAKTIAVTCQKGGVGKTSITVNVGACFAALGRSVLLIACDAQRDMTDKYLASLEEYTDDCADLASVFSGTVPADEAVYTPAAFPVFEEKKNLLAVRRKKIGSYTLDFLPAGWDLNFLTTEDHALFSRYLDGLREKYDYILLDLPPSYSPVTILAMDWAEYVLIPVVPDSASFGGYSLVREMLTQARSVGRHAPELLGVVMNMYTGFNRDAALLDQLRELGGDDILETVIPKSQVVGDAAEFGVPVISWTKNVLYKSYLALARELLQRIGEEV